jgi:hypothetical protein
LSPWSARSAANASAENTKGWPSPSSYVVTAAHDGSARHAASRVSMTVASTPGISPSSIMIAAHSPAWSSPASSDDAQPVPYSAL